MRDRLVICYEDDWLIVAREKEDRNEIVNKFEGESAIELYSILIDDNSNIGEVK